MELLRSGLDSDRPAPYDRPEIDGLPIDEDRLLPLSEFTGFVGPLNRLGHSFSVLAPLPAHNSAYWLTMALRKHVRMHGLTPRIRLDPLLHGPEGEFGPMEHRAWWYGTQLDWDKIGGLKQVLHRQAGPDTTSENLMSRTDVAWVPRSGHVHFHCEELPPRDQTARRGSRYLHGIYDRSRSCFIHLDGAIRLLSSRELEERMAVHVHESGKVGHRIKVFRLDGEVARDTFGDIAASFFYWNEDVSSYLCGETELDD